MTCFLDINLPKLSTSYKIKCSFSELGEGVNWTYSPQCKIHWAKCLSVNICQCLIFVTVSLFTDHVTCHPLIWVIMCNVRWKIAMRSRYNEPNYPHHDLGPLTNQRQGWEAPANQMLSQTLQTFLVEWGVQSCGLGCLIEPAETHKTHYIY